MIFECVFLVGLFTGVLASLILVVFFYREDKRSREFDERQKKYKKMI